MFEKEFKAIFLLLLLIPLHLQAASNWMSNFQLKGSKSSLSEYQITPEELDGMIFAYADSYMTQMVSATRDLVSQSASSEQRRNAMLLRVGSTNSIYDIATNPDPFTKLLDMLLVVTLQSYVWIDEDRAEKMFGSSAQILINAMHQNRLEIWKLATRVMTAEQLYTLDWLIMDWRRQNPDIKFVVFTRFTDVSASRGKSLVSDVKIGTGLLAPVDEAKKVLDETRLLAERSFFYAKRAPLLYSWQAESLTDNMLAKPEIAELLNGINRSAKAIERVSLVMEKIPQQIREERNFISAELDKRESSLSKLLAEVRQTLGETEHLVLTVNDLSGSGESLLQELRATSDSLNSTLKTFDGVMNNHFAAKPGEPKSEEKSKPFDINEYTQALVEIDNAAVELTNLMSTSGDMIQSDRMTRRIEQLNNAAKDRVDHATQQSEIILKSIFIYATLTLILIFLLFISYRFICKRIGKKG